MTSSDVARAIAAIKYRRDELIGKVSEAHTYQAGVFAKWEADILALEKVMTRMQSSESQPAGVRK